ncbi:hypothetical protein D9613_003301 [Agrocybe pediades]|uniref:Dicer-like protein 1 n=1 Tax=Agrocybe pediades TaxID=84607 RepID=A0A8H4VP53_9AGAR|nr:hypothetical protein D9613_003301 [Agrocybe pediades]
MAVPPVANADLKSTLEKLVPRRYQEEVFERAQKGNIIAALDTGSGKTLISLLLIKWITSLEKSNGKIVVFLVPKVTLVEQQHAYIQKNSSLKVLKLHGAQDLDLSDRVGWRRRFEGCSVAVMTAQIFLNIMTHSLWPMSQVSLMIFDECHHARKNHPYNGILREYFQQPSELRPKIFGMTASPIWNIRDPLGSLSTLEANLDAKVTAVREHVAELADHAPRAQEVIKEYPPPPFAYDYPSPTIHQCLSVIPLDVWNKLDIPWTNIDTRYAATLYNLGPYCASLFIYQEVQHHIGKIINEQKHLATQNHDEDAMEGMIPTSISSTRKELPEDFFLIIDILLDFEPFFPHETSSSLSKPLSIPPNWCSPKLIVLIDVLEKYYEHTPAFQCIIFVEQRQVASALAAFLPNVPQLHGKIHCGYLVGTGVNSEGVSKYSGHQHGDPVKLFRDHKINILIATSVAEEGLDFKECDLVVRYDPLHHMVGYVQSRGRARKQGSTFIVMIEQNDVGQLEKYRSLQRKEPEVNHVYQTRHVRVARAEADEDEDDIEEDTDPADLLARERYVVPCTGAVLNYDNCLNLLNLLCSLIPRDPFTPAQLPEYTGGFEVTIRLPRTLPLPPGDLTFTGPPRRTKKEARRAAAFMAVKRLRQLDVFDEYLLPVAKHLPEEEEEALPKRKKSHKKKQPEVAATLNVAVWDPWCIGETLWIHPVVISDHLVAGLVTGTQLSCAEVCVNGEIVRLLPGRHLFDEESKQERRVQMHHFTRNGVWINNTSSPFTAPLSFYLVPVKEDAEPDFNAIEDLLNNPRGISDWSRISEEDYDNLLVLCRHRIGRIHLLKRIRQDLTPMSKPLEGSIEASASTYQEFWVNKWSNFKKGRIADVGADGPILETIAMPRSNDGTYSFELDSLPVYMVPDGRLLPQNSCTWLPFSYSMRRAYEVLPSLCHRITNIHRATQAQYELGLMGIPRSLVTEAFTIPAACLPFNNQRLETLGDAVLQVCTTVHLMNKYPTRHEGQLTNLRQKYVSNFYLMRRAFDVGLERFVNSEGPSVYKWRYTLSDDDDTLRSSLGPLSGVPPTMRAVFREYPRRSLQDCVEAILGAGFIAGGIPLALRVGTSLGLELGGPLPWFMRYRLEGSTNVPFVFDGLQESLGYKFRRNELLLESLTHPSFTYSDVPSYQRLEFLGDAILDLVTMKYLYDKFPTATSHQLSFPRMRAICAPTLANIAVRKLGLHKIMLINNMDLSLSIDRYVPVLERTSGEEIVRQGWKFDPPKALSDVFESLLGAVLVDSGYDYEKIAAVVEYVMADVLEALSPELDKDPVSDLMEWSASLGCRRVAFEKRTKEIGLVDKEGVAVLVHGVEVVGIVTSSSRSISKFAAAERALAVLRDENSANSLSKLCDCATAMDVDVHGTNTATKNKNGMSKHRDTAKAVNVAPTSTSTADDA